MVASQIRRLIKKRWWTMPNETVAILAIMRAVYVYDFARNEKTPFHGGGRGRKASKI
jgi:hypothetical protein